MIVDRHTDERICHSQCVCFGEGERGMSWKRKENQEGMTSSATQNDDDMNSENSDMDVIRFHVVNIELDRGKPA